MATSDTQSTFKAKLLRVAGVENDAIWAFAILPKAASAKLARRGRTTVMGNINGHTFQTTLEPDGKLSHWLPISRLLFETVNTEVATFEIMAAEHEPEPQLPDDFREKLAAVPEATAVWNATTTIARVDWIHWIASAKQAKTRALRVSNACDMLASGKHRVCCFDPSGFYSKALSAPKVAD